MHNFWSENLPQASPCLDELKIKLPLDTFQVTDWE